MQKYSMKIFLNCEIFFVFLNKCVKKIDFSNKSAKNIIKVFATCKNCKDFLSNMRNFSRKLHDASFFMIFKKHMQKPKLIFLMQMQKSQNIFVKNLLNPCQKVSTFLFSSAIPYLHTYF